MESEEVHCCNGTLRMQGIAANQRRTAKVMITYSKLRGSNLYCKCSSLEDVIISDLPGTSNSFLSHELLVGNVRAFDFQRGFPPFGCKSFYADPMGNAEPTLASLNTGWRYRPLQQHPRVASTSHLLATTDHW